MRYYCKNCGSEFILGPNAECIQSLSFNCPCSHRRMEQIPDYESPQQYKARTGKKWAVDKWVYAKRTLNECKSWGAWFCMKYGDLEIVISLSPKEVKWVIICVQCPNPPPDDWQQEEDKDVGKN